MADNTERQRIETCSNLGKGCLKRGLVSGRGGNRNWGDGPSAAGRAPFLRESRPALSRRMPPGPSFLST